MNSLLYKELKLVSHPTSWLFLGLSALMLVPNYPYYVTFFYTMLGVFFVCLTGRENHDIFYTVSLPIRKRDMVKARFLFVIMIELAQLVVAIPFAWLRNGFNIADNAVGIEANVAFFGLSLLMMGLFNLIFFIKYYRDPDKVGLAFVVSNIPIWLYMIVAEACVHAIPFMRDCIDTRDPAFLGAKLIFLLAGALAYALLTWIAYRRSIHSFETLDL